MYRKPVIVLDIIAIILTGIWIIYGVIRGLSSSDLIFNYMYSVVVLTSLILTLADQLTEE